MGRKPCGVDDRLHLAGDGLAADPLDGGKDDLAPVERGDGQEVEYGEVDADIARDLQKVLDAHRGELRRHGDGRHRPAEGVQSQPARQQFAEDAEDGARDLEGIDERAADRLEKPELDGGIRHQKVALFVLRRAECAPQKGGVGARRIFHVCAQHDGDFRPLPPLCDALLPLDDARDGEGHEIALLFAVERRKKVGREIHVPAVRL